MLSPPYQMLLKNDLRSVTEGHDEIACLLNLAEYGNCNSAPIITPVEYTIPKQADTDSIIYMPAGILAVFG